VADYELSTGGGLCGVKYVNTVETVSASLYCFDTRLKPGVNERSVSSEIETSVRVQYLMSQALHIRRRRLHRIVFIFAGLYNILWGLYSVWDPQWLFRFSGLPLQNHPQIFACLGMVVGLYGIIYFEVARVPERGWLLAAVGLLGKVLGPIGLVQLIWTGAWPISTVVLCATNDLIWWLPFSLYLYDSWPAFKQTYSSR
jgi:hypothetical protein